MSSIALALDDVGLAIRLQEVFEGAGYGVKWDAALAAGPKAGQPLKLDAVALSGDADEATLRRAVNAWRDSDPPPAIVVLGSGPAAEQAAQAANATFLHSGANAQAILAALASAIEYRHTVRMSPAYARAAMGIPRAVDDIQDTISIIRAARRVDIAIIRRALRTHVQDYVAAGPLIATLREYRALEIPEVEFVGKLSGAITVQTMINRGGMDQMTAGRLVWALTSIGAVSLTPEPMDVATPRRRAVVEMRRHLRARQLRLARATCYDVLEIPRGAGVEYVQHGYQSLAMRYSPDLLANLDLGDLTPLVKPMWEQVTKSHEVLCNGDARHYYDQMLASRPQDSLTPWSSGAVNPQEGEVHFRAGQKALVDGDAYRGVSEFAAACRNFSDHPDYEVSLSWARYRAAVARGTAREEVIGKERAAAEKMLEGRRPWPRAMVALALLCASDNDANAARWHLTEALRINPDLPAARQLLNRLG